MDERLIDSDSLPLERKSLLPGAGFFYPDEFDEERAEREAAETLAGAPAVVVADTDADGLACTAIIRAARGDDPDPVADPESFRDEDDDQNEDETADALETGVLPDEADADDDRPDPEVALLGAGPHDFPEALARVVEYGEPGLDVYVCDLCPDSPEDIEALDALTDHAGSVRWFDHHQWDEDLATTVRAAGVDLVVGDSDEVCTADVALAEVGGDLPARFTELAEVTRDHDLWIRDDPRSDDLSDYAYWSGSEEYAAVVQAHGADLPEWVEAYVAERRVEKEALIEKAVARAELREVGPWTVGVTYGRCSQNEVAEALREQGADAAVVVKPAGSASIRGTETFERAHEVAGKVGGGGHPKAAGCKPDIYDDMLDYAHHWTTRGAVTKQAILDAFRLVAAEMDDDEEGVDTDR
jgi:oligoribonuclease NrnB/cAMP/cGMP phosphodiesterase (DHH superfamily)